MLFLRASSDLDPRLSEDKCGGEPDMFKNGCFLYTLLLYGVQKAPCKCDIMCAD